MSDELLRGFAPITPSAWQMIDQEASRVLQDKVAEMARNIPLPFRGDLPAQPRPDDADDREYPARGGRDD